MPNLVLTGFMGTGKTTAGMLAAQKLGMPFVDTDTLIEADAGMSVSEIFAHYGEAHFRMLEKEVCRRLALETGRVVALGGGALVDPASRSLLQRSGVLVLLLCEESILFSRLEASASRGERPLLAGDFRQRASELKAAREAVYQTVDLRIDTTNLTPEQVASDLARIYQARTGTVKVAL